MRNLFLSLILSVVTLYSFAQDVRIGRIIALHGNVKIDNVPAKPGQEIFDNNSVIHIIDRDSYVFILLADGVVKRYTTGTLPVHTLKSSLGQVPLYKFVQGSQFWAFEWMPLPLEQPQILLGDSVFLQWRTKISPPFEVDLTDIFDEELESYNAENRFITLFVGDLLNQHNRIVVQVQTSQNSERVQLFIVKIDSDSRAIIERELSQVTGTAADQKVIRLALLDEHSLTLDFLFEKSLLTAEEIAMLSPDTKNLLERLNNPKAVGSVRR